MKPFTLVKHRNGTFSIKEYPGFTYTTKKEAEGQIRILYLWKFGDKIATNIE
jgi:hypothetical protein